MSDLTGQRFGRRVVTGRASGDDDRWHVQCDCGTEGIARGYHLRGGRALSCGCLQREKAADAHRTHGLSGVYPAEYQIWKSMKQRCENPRARGFKRYGARGIQVHASWSSSFEAFMKDMGPRPSGLHSVERKDNDGNYEPANCLWATRKEQNRNQGRTVRVTVDGTTRCAADWEDGAGLQRKRVPARLKLGWSPSDAVSRPAQPRTKLTPEKRDEILREYAQGGVSQSALGLKHGVHGTTIRDLVMGRSHTGRTAC